MPDHEPAANMPPWPPLLSEAARGQLSALTAAAATATAPPTLEQARMFADQVQAMVGAEQRKAHAVTVTEDAIAGVPVRAPSPAPQGRDRSRQGAHEICMAAASSWIPAPSPRTSRSPG